VRASCLLLRHQFNVLRRKRQQSAVSFDVDTGL
jgi:hypothetical protein